MKTRFDKCVEDLNLCERNMGMLSESEEKFIRGQSEFFHKELKLPLWNSKRIGDIADGLRELLKRQGDLF